MQHLHLNLYNAYGDAPDDEGSDFVDLAAARVAALAGIRSLLSAEVMEGKLNLHGHLDIVDERDVVLARVDFQEALSIVGP